MKVDIRQIMDIFDDCGYELLRKESPQSFDNWRVDSVYEFESEFKKVLVSFTVDPTVGYFSSKHSRRKQKRAVTLNTADFVITGKATGELTEYELDLRQSDSEDISRLRSLLTFL